MGESLLVPDVEQSEEYVSYPLLPDVRSELAVPLKVREKVIGVLDVKSDRAFDLNVQDAALLEILAPQIAIAVQNAQLFEKLQQKTQELSGLYEAALVTSSELNLQPLLHRLYEQIQKLLDPDFFVVALYNGEEVNVVLAIERDKTVPDTVEIPLSLEESGLTGLVIQSRESVYIRDLHNDTLPIKPRYVSRTRSWLGVPLIARGQVIGALSVQSRHPRAYTEAQQRFLESLGGQVAIALENARLFQSTIEVNRRLSILHSTSQEFVTAGVGPEKVYTAIHAAASQLMRCEGFVISLLSSEDEIHAVYLVDKNGRSPARRIPLSQGISGRIIRTGESLLISEINESADFEAVHFGSSDTTRSALAVPLKLGGKVFGMLSAQSYTPRAYGPEDQRLLEMLASHAAAALENMRLLEAERERRVELEELDELKSEFIQNVSHELRTPLAIVRGYTELLETGDLGELKPEQKGAVDIIARRARMLSSMVSDLIAILETEARQFHYEPVDLVALLQSIVDDFKMNFVEAQLSLEAEIQAEEAFIEGDSVHLRRVCDNLLSNALKFTPAAGQVEVRLHKNTTTVTLEVSDSGIGIPTEKIDRIFERFYQVDGSMTRRYGGTGLGLALVKEVVESHGGQIDVESEVGEGTTFRIHLPLLDRETDPERSTKR
jgi:signal transduction histidine kinase